MFVLVSRGIGFQKTMFERFEVDFL